MTVHAPVAPAEAGASRDLGTPVYSGPGFRRGDALRTRPLVATAVAILALLLIFAPDLRDMASLWWNVSTYQHCLFVLPIIGWLIWQRRDELADVPVAGWPQGLGLVLCAGLVWLAGQAGGVALLRHVGLVLMVQASVVAILGPALARAIAFPLFYLVFLIPFGDEFVGPMQTLTARMTMALLGLSGIPATLDGVFITTPAGWFEVAEACAGVKFLIAMVALGALVAHVCFKSFRRRAIFMTAAIVVPVLANGVRAWGTIYAAELTSVEAAGSFDHIVYGWFFFAIVMAVILGAGWPFFDRRIGDPWIGWRDTAPWRPVAPVLLMAPLAVAAAALPPLWDALVAPMGQVSLPHAVALPEVRGWTRIEDRARLRWVPRFDGADHRLLGHYADAAGRRVDVAVALYGWQAHGREIVAFGQGAADPDGHWKWAADLPRVRGARAERLLGTGQVEREAVTFWQVGGRPTMTRADVKRATLVARLTGADQSAAVLILSAEGRGSRQAIDAFLQASGDPWAQLSRLVAAARTKR